MFVDSERKDVFGFRKKRMFWQNVSAMFLDSERKDVFGFSRVSRPEWGLVNWNWSFTPWSPLLPDGEGLDEWIRALTPLAPVLRNFSFWTGTGVGGRRRNSDIQSCSTQKMSTIQNFMGIIQMYSIVLYWKKLVTRTSVFLWIRPLLYVPNRSRIGHRTKNLGLGNRDLVVLSSMYLER